MSLLQETVKANKDGLIKTLITTCKELSRLQHPAVLLTVTAQISEGWEDDLRWDYYPCIMTVDYDDDLSDLLELINKHKQDTRVNHRLWVFHNGVTMVEPKMRRRDD